VRIYITLGFGPTNRRIQMENEPLTPREAFLLALLPLIRSLFSQERDKLVRLVEYWAMGVEPEIDATEANRLVSEALCCCYNPNETVAVLQIIKTGALNFRIPDRTNR
jgi:hypothetical protein